MSFLSGGICGAAGGLRRALAGAIRAGHGPAADPLRTAEHRAGNVAGRAPAGEAVMAVDERIENARRLYERAAFAGDAAALAEADRGLDGVEADLALARGRILHTRYLHQRDADPGQAREDPDELPLSTARCASTGRSATYEARRRRC